MEEGKEYVDYKVIRGKTIVNSQHLQQIQMIFFCEKTDLKWRDKNYL